MYKPRNNWLIKDVKRGDAGLIAAIHVITARTMIAVESFQENATNQDALTQIFTHHYVLVSVISLHFRNIALIDR